MGYSVCEQLEIPQCPHVLLQQHGEVEWISSRLNMMDCNLACQSNTLLCGDDQIQQLCEEEFHHTDIGMFGLQFRLEMKNLTMFKCPRSTARCRTVSLLAFLFVGSQCFLIVRNFTTSM